jgi:hypothetical protein
MARDQFAQIQFPARVVNVNSHEVAVGVCLQGQCRLLRDAFGTVNGIVVRLNQIADAMPSEISRLSALARSM